MYCRSRVCYFIIQIEKFLRKNDLDYQPETVIRREINLLGRSSFINDTPVTLHQLKALSNQLVDVHSQHQTLLLNKHNFSAQGRGCFCRT